MLSCHGHHDLLLTHPTLDFHSSNVSNRFDFERVLPLEGLEEEEEGEEEGGWLWVRATRADDLPGPHCM